MFYYRIILDLEKSCKGSRESFHIFFPQLPLRLTSHMTKLLVSKLRDEYWYHSVKVRLPGGSGGKRKKNLPAMRKTRVQSLSQEDPLEKEMTTHSSILSQRIPWTEKPGGPQSRGSKRVGHD